jgi:hypothetical protein
MVGDTTQRVDGQVVVSLRTQKIAEMPLGIQNTVRCILNPGFTPLGKKMGTSSHSIPPKNQCHRGYPAKASS